MSPPPHTHHTVSGQVLTSSAVLEEASTPAYGSTSHGAFALRNIAEPVEVVEVLWRHGQQARAPLGVEPAQ
jgi:class 3 adenylate cyclase